MHNTSMNPRALAALFGGAVAIGFAPIFVRLSEVGPTATAFWRVLLALPVLWIWQAFTPVTTGPVAAARRPPLHPLLAVGLFFAADLAVWHQSIRLTTVANATLLANLSSVVVTFIAWRFLGQRIRPLFLAGLALSLIGCATLMGVSLSLDLQRLLGDALGLATAFFYAGYILATQRLRVEGWSTAAIVSRGTLVTALALAPLVLLLGEPWLPRTVQGWGILLGLAVLSHATGQTLIAYALAHLPGAFAAVALSLQPVVAAALASLLLHEVPAPVAMLGGAIVLVGIYLAARGSASQGR